MKTIIEKIKGTFWGHTAKKPQCNDATSKRDLFYCIDCGSVHYFEIDAYRCCKRAGRVPRHIFTLIKRLNQKTEKDWSISSLNNDIVELCTTIKIDNVTDGIFWKSITINVPFFTRGVRIAYDLGSIDDLVDATCLILPHYIAAAKEKYGVK